jgi:hypothetical protein
METPGGPQPDPPLGPRVELFTASRASVYVGFVLGTLITLGGLGMAGCGLTEIPAARAAATPKEKERATAGFLGGLFVGGLLALFGIGGIWMARSLAGTGVEICENGFRVWPPDPDAIPILWGDVTRIEEQFIRDRVPLKLGGPLMSQTFRRFVVVCRNGRQFAFDYENIRRIGRLGKRLREIALARSIQWVIVGKPD